MPSPNIPFNIITGLTHIEYVQPNRFKGWLLHHEFISGIRLKLDLAHEKFEVWSVH